MVNDGQLIFSKSYFNEECQTQIVDGMEMMFPIRKISTYINAMIDAGFIIENMVEQTNENTLQMIGEIDDRLGKHKNSHYLLSLKRERHSVLISRRIYIL